MSMSFAQELRHVAPPGVRVLEVTEGFDELLGVCRKKHLFDRPVWTVLDYPGDSEEAQLHVFFKETCPKTQEAALWTQGTYFRVVYRKYQTIAWSRLSVGSGMTLENRQDFYRALWDVGIRELHNRVLPDNPHTKTIQRIGHFSYEEEGPYLHGVLKLDERP